MVNLRDSTGRSLYFSNRKEYYRRKRISAGVRKSRAQKLQIEKKERIRKQVVFNADYNYSVRAITINNPNVTLEQLEGHLRKWIKENLNMGVSSHLETKGLEIEEISTDEDKKLKDGVIYIETNFGGNVTLINL